MFRTNTIRDRIMEALDAHLFSLQTAYEEECRRLDEKLVTDKADLADKMVNGVLEKIL